MKFLSTLLTLFLFVVCSISYSQSENAFFEWVSKSGEQQFYYQNASATDLYGNIYVTGATINADGDYDVLLAKYDRNGDEQWSETWSGSADGHDMAADIILDSNGDLIITGATFTGNSSPDDYDMILMKYNPSGVQQWMTTFDGPFQSYDGGVALTSDSQNNIYVAAGSYGVNSGNPTMSDYSIQKYNSSGTLQWENRYNQSNLMDVPAKISFYGGTGSVVVTGASQYNSNSWRMVTLDINGSTGNTSNLYWSGTSSASLDRVTDLAKDSSDNYYVVGAVENSGQGKDVTLIKLDDELDEEWSVEWNSLNDLDDLANGVTVDGSGNVYVTGYTTNANGDRDYLLLKYDSSGSLQWSETISGEDGGDDTGVKVKIEGSSIVSCGEIYRDGNLDIALFSYDSSGSLEWKTFYCNDDNLDDHATNIAISGSDIYVSGQADQPAGNTTYLTLKYSLRAVHIPAENLNLQSYVNFQDNYGQVINEDGNSDTTSQVYYNQRNPQIYINDDFYSLVYSSHSDSLDSLQRVDFEFYRPDKQGRLYTHGLKDYYSIYHLGHLNKPVYRSDAHERAIHFDLYEGIEFIYSADEHGYCIYMVCMPGSDPSDAELKVSGHDSMLVTASGQLEIQTQLGSFHQTKPEAFYMNSSTGALTELAWSGSYLIQSDKVKINTGTYSQNEILVLKWGAKTTSTPSQVSVQENLGWSTYFGGEGNDNINCIDSWGNKFYAAGSTSSPLLPEENFFLVYNSSDDKFSNAFVAKFIDTEPKRLLYYGGSSWDSFYSIAHEPVDNRLHLVGGTASNDINFISDYGINDNTYNGGEKDAFYLELSKSFTIICDSYIGGIERDEAWSVATEATHLVNDYKVYLVGITTNATGFPVQQFSGTFYQPPHSTSINNEMDGFIIELDESRERSWTTYYGGQYNDFVTDVAVVDNQVAIVGRTNSDQYSVNPCSGSTDGGFPVCNQGSTWYQNQFISEASNGNSFIAVFNDSKNLIYSSYYGLSNTSANYFDGPRVIGNTKEGDEHYLYFAGVTPNLAVDEFPISPFSSPGYNQDFAGEEPDDGQASGFIAKFKLIDDGTNPNEVEHIGSTFYGSDERMINMDVDIHESESGNATIFIGGREWMDSESSVLCTPPTNGDFPVCDGNGTNYTENSASIGGQYNHSFIAAFRENMEMIWSSPYGMGDGNGMKGISVSDSYVFMGGFSYNNFTLFDPGEGYYQPFQAGSDDGAFARFDLPSNITSIWGDSEEPNNSVSFSIYPNPSQGAINLHFENNPKQNDKIIIYDMSGRVVKEVHLANINRLIQVKLQVESGIYMAVYFSQNSRELVKFEIF
ncbi:DUF7948 domain-containing protein [Halocola ammonii]